MNLIRVSIVEDDERVRKSLAALIERSGFCELVSAYGSAEDALKELVLNSPDVLLMDIHLPGISGVECVNRLRAIDFKGVRPEIVMLTVYEESQNIFDALQAGATGYLLKRAGSEEILEAIQSVRQGGAPMSSHIARKVVQSFRRLPLSPQTQHSDSESLSKRRRSSLSGSPGLHQQGNCRHDRTKRGNRPILLEEHLQKTARPIPDSGSDEVLFLTFMCL